MDREMTETTERDQRLLSELDDEPGILDRLAKLAARRGDMEVLWLYGSRAKGDARPDSDFDLAVAFASAVQPSYERRLRPEVIALEWSELLGLPEDKVSLLDINLAPLPLAMSVVTSGKVIWCGSGLRLAREESRVTSMWELDYRYHQRLYG